MARYLFQLSVSPIIVGGGLRAFLGGVRHGLQLLRERRFDCGFVFFDYGFGADVSEGMCSMQISEATPEDVERVLWVEREAFGNDEVPDLVAALLADATARPVLSLLAWDGPSPIGHVMFTTARLDREPQLRLSILAPLAVVPDRQGRGVGGRLIEQGVEQLVQAGTDLVFVLGHPGYYPRHGFAPALPLGLDAPHAISPPEAWMVRALRPGLLGTVGGTVVCADALDRPEHWRE